MTETDSLIVDIQRALENKEPPYLAKRPRLDPDSLLYRALETLKTTRMQVEELEEKTKEMRYEIKELERQLWEKD